MVRTMSAALLAIFAAAGSASAAQTFRTDYSITLMGIPVGKASFTSVIGDDDFRIDGQLASAGMARLFDSTQGTTSVSGGLSSTGTAPRSYDLNYRSDKKAQRTAIRFSGGTVTATENVPPTRPRPGDWVHLQDDHLTSVVDPISSTLVRAASPAEVCNRTIRIYDGEMRANLRLSPAGAPQGGQVTCTARFEPVAGYRPSRSALRYLRDRSRISIAFAPLADTGFYAPVDASIGTQVGTLRIVAQTMRTQ
ncbi:DUF3108 domain-containing protein [Mesorhizobium sp. YIM 152430]|uniref:DUF3108 domain-containing protein n=1 Tax=Mesorhizobium sp. YIM 152430 TaxID=3031761 RepID=UPI0023D9CE82|nr:DUF3108 domain-containing protein [Mesorhizobium sp. YIM 152430]MDF1598186.1 DUF3108 domain-containing protein [Mesorhizobium sp. YIM 152430]